MIIDVKKSGFGRQKFRFTLKGDNGEVVAQSEKYNNYQDCLKTVEMIKAQAATARVNDSTP